MGNRSFVISTQATAKGRRSLSLSLIIKRFSVGAFLLRLEIAEPTLSTRITKRTLVSDGLNGFNS